ncbi:ATP-binding protein [Paraoerskovia marina]|uniref:AAA ATPase domain-containing protein n=1 Tax=Paraoerskovia marina TaxID=545619 RepID=A0A1H1LYB8_9CELL|nr:ATP-binding protein [Paraoerskovia marina]SDR79556.1 AAA ATPase domain-containing protein [Paraoerskovia marina]
MDSALNPFTPGSGARPAALVGRDSEIAAATALIRRAAANNKPARSQMLWGLRGVGKTVLLKEIRDSFVAAGWLTVSLEAQRDENAAQMARRALARDLIVSARKLRSRRDKVGSAFTRMLETITAFSLTAGVAGVSFGVDLKPSRGRADSNDLDIDLLELVEDATTALAEEHVGFVVFVDEIQDLDPTTLASLLSAQHAASQDGRHFYVFGAGLPNVPATLSEARSYAERQFDYREIDRLKDSDARLAFTDPVQDRDVEFAPGAVDSLVTASGRYPYFIQEFGHHAWELASGDTITSDDADLAASHGTDALDRGFFRARWERATRAEQTMMAAMAQDGDGRSTITDVVERLGKSRPSDLSVRRKALIAKGLIYAPARAELAFTVPHMGAYISRVHHDLL